MLVFFAYLVTGAFAGLTAGLIGVGGGVVTVPFLDLLWQSQGASDYQAFAVARGTSLAIMVFTSASAAYGHYRRGAVSFPWAMRIAAGGLIGASLGSLLGLWVSADLARGSFGILALLVCFQFLRGRKTNGATADQKSTENLWLAYLLGIIVGGFSAFFGVGGGVVAVPAMTYLLGFQIHRAVGTSSSLISVLGLVGAGWYVAIGLKDGSPLTGCLGYVDLKALALIAVASFIFARLGVILSHRLPARGIELIFAVYALGIGVKMLLFS